MGDASVIEQFYKPKQKKFFKFKFGCNPLTGSQNIMITSYFSYTCMTPNARYIHVLSLMVIHPSVLMIMQSQAIFAYIMSPLTFDLLTPKSNQFIGSASYIHDQSLVGIHPSVLEITRSRERDVRTYVRT